MRKSFTRLFSLVMLFTLLSSVVMATFAGDATKVLPIDPSTGTTKAWTKTTDKIMVIYPGAVQASTGSVRVSTGGGALVAVLPATDSRISYAKGDTVVIDLSATLKELTNYVVSIDQSTFKTVAATPVNKGPESWTFTTGDYSAPTLKSVLPVKGAVISGNPTISLVMTFEDASPASTELAGNVALYKEDGNVWDLITVATGSTCSLTTSGSDPYTYTLTLTGIRDLEDNVNYAVTIGAGVVKDNGQRADNIPSKPVYNAFAGMTDRTVWTFSTKDFSAPTFELKAGAVTNNSVSVIIKTNEPATAYAVASTTTSTISGGIENNANKKTVSITAGGTEYTTILTKTDGGANLTGNSPYFIQVVTMNGDGVTSTVQYVSTKTSENIPPVLTAVKYMSDTYSATTTVNASNVVADVTNVDQGITNIILTFFDDNAGIKLGSGNIIIKKVVDNTVFATIPVSSLTLGGTTTTATQTVKIPVSGLANGTSYYATIPSTLVLDKFDNAYGGISSTSGWKFTTNDNIKPTVTYSPADGATGVAEDAKIVLTFSEPVFAATSTYTFSAGAGASSPFELKVGTATLTFAAPAVTNNSKTITITPGADFNSSDLVTVYIKPGSVVDGAGNIVDTQGQGVSFVVKDIVGPVITWDTLPTKATTDPIVAKFDEAIYSAGGGEITNANLYTILLLKNNSNNSNVPYTSTIDATKKVITITPSSAWASEGSYLVGVSADLEDASGNDFSGTNRTATITIADVTPATVDLSSVDGKVLPTTATATLTFTKPDGTTADPRATYYYNGSWSNTYTAPADLQKVIILKKDDANGADVAFTVTGGANSATFTITPSVLAENSTYYLGIGASTKGSDGNINVAKFVTFTTGYEDVPEVTSFLPVEDATQVSKTSNFVVTFNTDVVKATTASITFSDGTTTGTISSASAEVSISKNVVTINPSSDSFLSDNKTYMITIPAGTFKNKNSAAVNEIITDWNITTTDTRVDLVSLSEDNSTATSISAQLKLGFSEKVSTNIGYFDIKKSATDALVERIDVVSSQVVLSDDQKMVTITPTANFQYNTSYYVEVAEGTIKDLKGNLLVAIDGKTVSSTLSEWTFTTKNPDLEIVKTTPVSGSDKVANDAAIVIEFNREIAAGTGAVGYVESSTTTTQDQFYPIGSDNVTISGKTLTITHANKVFPANNRIYIYLQAGAVKALSDPAKVNVGASMTSTTTYYFNTNDVNAPKPTFDPAQFDSDKPVYTAANSNVTITFDEEIYKADGAVITNGDLGSLFSIVYGTSSPVDFSGSISGKVVTLTPTSPLGEFTDYKISVLPNVIEDINGITLGSTVTSTFKTADTKAPVVTAPVLTSGDEKIVVPAINIVDDAGNNKKFYYLLRVKSTDAAPTVDEIKAANYKDVTGSSLAGFELKDLVASTTYQFYYVAADKFGNTSAVAVVEGSTNDTVAPLLVSTNPIVGAVDVNVASGGTFTVTLTFNEKVVPGTGTALVTVKDFATQSLYASTTSITSVSGDTKSVNLTITCANLVNAAATKVYVEVPAGLIVDTASPSNSYAGAFGVNTINFTTEDNKAPTVDKPNSTKGSVELDANITIAFSENVKAGNGTLVLYDGTTTATTSAIQVFTAAEATFSGKKATVNPTADFKVGHVYTLSVNDGFAKDLSTNANNNVALVDGTLTFTATTNVRPYVVNVNPEATTTIPTGRTTLASIQVGFNEPIYLSVAGLSKPLMLLSQAELLAHVSLTDGSGNAIAIGTIEKVGTSSITISTPSASFKDKTDYILTIKGFEDNKGLVMLDEVVNYTTGDGVAPEITFNPADEAEKVNPTAALTLTFSEDFYADVVSATDKVFAYVDNSNVDTFVYLNSGTTATGTVPVDFKATISGKVITIVPTTALESGKTYYYGMIKPVEDISGQAITLDVAGETYATFTVADIVAPKVVSFSPNSTSTDKAAKMYVNFNEDVVVSTGSVVIRREDGTIFQTVSSTGLSIDADVKSKLKIAHNDFEPFTNYFVEIGASTVVDKSGNPNALFNSPTPEDGWLFTTADTYALTASVTPMGDNTPRNVNLTMTFNKVPATRATDRYLAVYKADGTAVAQFAASDVVVSGTTATFPTIALDANQAYYARVEANAFADTPGNKFAGIMDNSWTFSTVNNISPKVVTLAPADNLTSVDTQTSSLVMTFDRNIALGAGSIALRYADGSLVEEVQAKDALVNGMTLTINLTQSLMAHKEYYVIVPAGAVTNTEITKDPFAGILNTYTWNFTTATDLTAPTAIYTPNGTTTPTTDNHPSLQMTFNEDVTVATGNVKIYKASDNTAIVTIPVTAAMLSGKTVSLTYAGGLDQNTNYYVLVDAGVVKDLAGNAFAGVTASTTWTFKTGDHFLTGTDPKIDNSLEFKVYPNPFVDYVTVSNASELSKVVVSNIAGQIVKEVVNPESTIQLNELRSGVYFISLYQDGAVLKTVKLLKR